MSNLNKVLLIGRVGADPEVRYTKSGQVVADLRIATNDYWKDKQGNRQERTEWHSIVLWGQQAEFAQNYIKKGRLIFVEGRLQTRDWMDNQNNKRYKTEVVATTLQLLDRQQDGEGGGPRPSGRQDSGYAPSGGGQRSGGPSGGGQVNEPEEAYIEDDIPF
ncbi:MAG TPA: single-stranded DNA-binding protein [bacterium]|nr:single-stranded DNA-binding protein [bacterium]